MGAGLEGELLGPDVAEPRGADDACAGGFEHGDRLIGGAGVDGDDLRGQTAHGIEGPTDGRGVVPADDGDGEGQCHAPK